jgi:hypothetical protein
MSLFLIRKNKKTVRGAAPGVWAALVFLLVSASPVRAQSAPEAPAGARNFYQVLDEVLADFEHDLKTGQVIGMKDLSIRNLVTSENIPPSFKSHLELLVTERILKVTKSRVVHCLACRSKSAKLNGETMVITSAETNAAELQRIARMNGVQNFMDVAFAYQPTGMILSIQISDVEAGTTLWTRNYNSETTRAVAQRRGVDFQELEEAKTRMEYQSTMQIRPVLYTVMAPKATSGYSTALGFGLRMMERYDNRQKEVGFEANYYADVNLITGLSSATTDTTNLYNSFNFTLLFQHGWALFGPEENFNKARSIIIGGIGGTYAKGFLGGLLRATYEWRMAKHWTVSGFVGYRPKGTLVITTTQTAAVSGLEGGIGVGYIF